METMLTWTALGLGVALMVGVNWHERRPRASLDVPLISTTPVLFAGALIAIVAIVHLLSLYGVELPRRGM